MFTLQFWLRQSRRASFRILFAAVVLAVAAITSVGVFSARLEAALMRDATQMLGGDLVIESKRQPQNRPWQTLIESPQFDKLQTAQSATFPSVIPSERVDLLVSMKAVNEAYPLVGQVRVLDANGVESEESNGPGVGKVWVDQGVLGSLGIELGDTITVGVLPLTVDRVILIEPDRGGGFVNFAPRVMIAMEDLAATELIGFGSRVRWNHYIAGDPNLISAFRESVKPLLTPAEELETLEGGRPEVAGTLDRAKDFLAMAALIGTLVACVGIGLVSHLFAREQVRELAVMKSLGFTPKSLIRLWLAGLGLLTFSAGAVGVLVGWSAHWGLMALLASLVGVDLPMAGLSYLPFGILLAGLLLLGFAAIPAWYALSSPAVAVIRAQATRFQPLLVVWSIGLGVVTTLSVCLLIVNNHMLALLLFGAFVGVSSVFALLFWSLLKGLAWLEERSANRSGQSSGIRIFRSMSRRSGTLVLQGVSLSLGLSALLILAVVQGDLIDRWQDVVPEDAPNRFIFNIQPDQVDPLAERLEGVVKGGVDPYPMVRGRLAQINGEILTAESFSNERAQRLIEREFNISFTDEVPKYNEVVQGQWFEPKTKRAQVSIESSVVDRLGLQIGDQLVFDFAGTTLEAELTSVRDLRWDSMEVNFYIIFPPEVLRDFPQTWITAFYAPEPEVTTVSRELVRQYPNITVLDTTLVIGQIREILSKVSQAVQFVFLFTVFSGGLVVIACILTGARARTRESAIYRVMGASSQLLQRAAWTELAVLGALAGLVAAVAAQGLGWAVAHYVFEFDYYLAPFNVVLGVVCGALISLIFGAWSVRRVCLAPVMRTLRHAAA